MSKEIKETETDEDFIQSSGELLRQARLGKELSISEISRITRISKSMIQSLENGEVENLPGRTYEIGYIKLICQVTNTNPDPIVKKWIDEYYFNKNPDPYNFPEPSSLQKRPIIANFGIILSVLIILSYSGWYFYSVNISEETTPIPNKEKVNINLLTQYDNNNSINSQDTDVSDNKSLEDNLSFVADLKTQPSELDKNEGFSEEKLNKKKNTFDNITNSIEKSNVSDVVENEIIENQTNSFDDNINSEDLSQSSITTLSGNNENNDNLKIGLYDIENYENFSFVGIEDSWLQIISTEGEMFYTGMVKKGDNLIVPNDKRLLITLGNAGAIGVEILNFGVKPIGQSGEIIQAVNLNYILNKISFVD